MAIQSLQKIIHFENELFQSEQLEQEKISAWIEKQQVGILQGHEKQLADLAKKKKDFKEQARADAAAKAAKILDQAKVRAEYLDTLDDSTLKESLVKSLTHIFGHGS